MLSRHERLASAGRVFTVILIVPFALARAGLCGDTRRLGDRSRRPQRRGRADRGDDDARRGRSEHHGPAAAHSRSAIFQPARTTSALSPTGSRPIRLTCSLAQEDRRELTLQLRVSAVSESIVVTAAQIDVLLTRTGAAVSVITEADLRAGQITTRAEALRSLPGLTVVGSGGRGAITSVFRAAAARITRWCSSTAFARTVWRRLRFRHLATTAVERIEVARGAQSAIFGSDALGGVVQVITKRDGPPRVGGLIEGGSQGTFRATADTAGSNGDVELGRRRRSAPTATALPARPPTARRCRTTTTCSARATGSLGWRKPGGADVLVSANYGHDERGYPGPFGSDPAGFYSGVDRVSRGTNDTGQIGARVAALLDAGNPSADRSQLHGLVERVHELRSVHRRAAAADSTRECRKTSP